MTEKEYYIYEKRLVGSYDDVEKAEQAINELKAESPDTEFSWVVKFDDECNDCNLKFKDCKCYKVCKFCGKQCIRYPDYLDRWICPDNLEGHETDKDEKDWDIDNPDWDKSPFVRYGEIDTNVERTEDEWRKIFKDWTRLMDESYNDKERNDATEWVDSPAQFMKPYCDRIFHCWLDNEAGNPSPSMTISELVEDLKKNPPKNKVHFGGGPKNKEE